MDRTAPGQSRHLVNEALRYRVAVDTSGHASSLTVTDRRSGCALCAWRGAVVDHMLEAGVVPREWRGGDAHFCGKHFVQHLALAGAAATLAIEQANGDRRGIIPVRRAAEEPPSAEPGRDASVARWPLLEARLRRLELELAGLHKRVAESLFVRPGCHLRRADVLCVLRLEGLTVDDHRVESCLDELAEYGVISRIDVDADNVFYDIKTFPHAHVFDPATRELHDVTVAGVVRLDGDAAIAALERVGDDRLRISQADRRIPG